MGQRQQRQRTGGGPPKRPDNWNDRRNSIDDIARRLDELLRDMADVPAAPAEGLRDSVLEAARQAVRARRERQRIFGSVLKADPGWDLLLELFIATGERRHVTVADISAGISLDEQTILRCIAYLAEQKLVARQPRPFEGEAMHLILTEGAVTMIADHLHRTMTEAGAADG